MLELHQLNSVRKVDMKMNNGLMIIFWTLILVTTLLSGCQTKSEMETQDAQRDELTLWSYYETEAQIQGLNTLVEDYNASQDKFRLSWEYVPMTEFDRSISRAYTEKDLPDLVIIDNPDMQRFIQLGIFVDITDYVSYLDMPNNFYDAAVDTTIENGRYYGVPFNCNNVCLILNSDITDGISEIPIDWASFYNVAKQVSEDGNYGFLMSAIDSEQGAFQILPWIMSTSERNGKISKASIEQTYAFLNSMVQKEIMPAECLNYSQNDVARRFLKGDIAMMENGPWVFPMLDKAGMNYSLMPLPRNVRQAVILGGENIAILYGKNIKGAESFIKFCFEQNGVYRFCKEADLLPARIRDAQRVSEENLNMRVIESQMNYAIPRTSIENWNTISGRLTKGFSEVVSGDVSAEQAADAILK